MINPNPKTLLEHNRPMIKDIYTAKHLARFYIRNKSVNDVIHYTLNSMISEDK